ncbi:MAG: hypothetical protein CL927_20945 [Deltaproteobacteria bacterium]|nr:hypothetical protein [Deltaproteobacteria bacterium]HCH61527.1 hypothetical protein [Deltaproteobacteria bacterium]
MRLRRGTSAAQALSLVVSIGKGNLFYFPPTGRAETPQPSAGPHRKMDERTQRILMVAMELAERDGYDAVRLRDLAEQAGVALATVYRRFSCKEDILAAALDLQVSQMLEMMRDAEVPGGSGEARLQWFFRAATDALAARPKLSAAMLRTVASGVPELAERVTRYHGRMIELILGVYRGHFKPEHPTEAERMLAVLLQDVWFGALVGWTGGMHPHETVIETVDTATRLLIAGIEVTHFPTESPR